MNIIEKNNAARKSHVESSIVLRKKIKSNCKKIKTPEQASLLFAIADGPLTIGEISAKTDMLMPAISRMWKNLQDNKLIVSQDDPSDKRSKKLKITKLGINDLKRLEK